MSAEKEGGGQGGNDSVESSGNSRCSDVVTVLSGKVWDRSGNIWQSQEGSEGASSWDDEIQTTVKEGIGKRVNK